MKNVNESTGWVRSSGLDPGWVAVESTRTRRGQRHGLTGRETWISQGQEQDWSGRWTPNRSAVPFAQNCQCQQGCGHRWSGLTEDDKTEVMAVVIDNVRPLAGRKEMKQLPRMGESPAMIMAMTRVYTNIKTSSVVWTSCLGSRSCWKEVADTKKWLERQWWSGKLANKTHVSAANAAMLMPEWGLGQ